MTPELRFVEDEIVAIASRYEYQFDEDKLIALIPVVLERG